MDLHFQALRAQALELCGLSVLPTTTTTTEIVIARHELQLIVIEEAQYVRGISDSREGRTGCLCSLQLG